MSINANRRQSTSIDVNRRQLTPIDANRCQSSLIDVNRHQESMNIYRIGFKKPPDYFFCGWAHLVGKMLADIMRVFVSYLEPPNAHIREKQKNGEFINSIN